MKTKKRIFLFAFGVLFFVGAHTVNAQVTIGSELEPNKGSLLDLKGYADGSATKGFNLPRVALISVSSLEPCVANASDDDKANHKGLQVYNTNSNLGEGIYVWNGSSWAQGGLKPVFKNVAKTVNEVKGIQYMAEFEIQTAGWYTISYHVVFKKKTTISNQSSIGLAIKTPLGGTLFNTFDEYSESWGLTHANNSFLLTPGKYTVESFCGSSTAPNTNDTWTINNWNFTVAQWP